MKLLLYSCFIALLSEYDCIGQDNPVEITGQVTHTRTKMPIPFASVRLNHSSVGTLCDEYGQFRLFLSSSPATSDTVTISCMGYESASRVWNDFQKNPIIVLRPAVILLDEIPVFREIPVKEIVAKMQIALQHTHADSPHQQWGFYKTSTKVAGNYVGFQDNYCSLYNQGYNSTFSDKKYTYLPTDIGKKIESRASNYSLVYGELGEPSKGLDLWSLLRIKKDIIHGDLFGKRSSDYFDWSVEDQTLLHGEVIYLLSFEPKAAYLRRKNKLPTVYSLLFKGIYSGRVYVHVSSGYVPVKIELDSTPYIANLKPVTNTRTNHISQCLGETVTIQFERFREEYYLSKIRYEKKYNDLGWVAQPTPPMLTEISGELTITTLNTQFMSDQEITKTYGRIEQFHEVKLNEGSSMNFTLYRPEFWKNYPITNRKLIKDLGGKQSLQNQFEFNSGKSIFTPEEYIDISKFYSTAEKVRLLKP